MKKIRIILMISSILILFLILFLVKDRTNLKESQNLGEHIVIKKNENEIIIDFDNQVISNENVYLESEELDKLK